MRLVLLACGSRGDVQPIFALALRLAEEANAVRIVTHLAHQTWLSEPAQQHGVETAWLSLPPARVWDFHEPGRPAQAEHSWPVSTDVLQAECLEACRGADAVVFNLFALEGYHIAESLGVPAIAASPCLVPAAAPAHWERSLQRRAPALCDALHAQGMWPAVQHWMWPLLSQQRWGAWRYHCLHLPSQPGGRLPSPLLLYGISEGLVPRPGHWPTSVQLTGFWHSPDCLPQGWQLPPAVERWLAAPRGGAKPMCVDFGSMGRMGLLRHPEALVEVVTAAAARLNRAVIVLTGGWAPLEQACEAVQLDEAQLLVVTQPLLHDALLPRCALLIHHGGAGTVAAALRAGVPSLVAPLHFDQPQWADRLEWLDLGMRLSSDTLLGCEEHQQSGGLGAEQRSAAVAALTHALQRVLTSASIARQCETMLQRLQEEDGVGVAARAVMQHIAGWQPPPEPPLPPGLLSSSGRENASGNGMVKMQLPAGLEVHEAPEQRMETVCQLLQRRGFAVTEEPTDAGTVMVYARRV